VTMPTEAAKPKVNFPETTDCWQTFHLSELAKIYDGTHQTPTYLASGIPFFSVEQVTSDNFSRTKFVSKEVYERENLRVKLERGDILMTRIGDVGTPRFIDWEVQASFYVSLALIKTLPTVDSKFLSYSIQTDAFQREIWKRTIHVAFPKKINLGEIGDCRVYLPQIAGQQKIADFLGAVDERIKLLQRRRDAVQLYKQDIMQRMFSQSIRFKRNDGSAFPDWKERTLGSVVEWLSTNSLSREMLTDEPGTVQNIHYGDIHGKFSARFFQSTAAVPFIKPHALPQPIRDELFCQAGDLVIADASEDYADIGKTIEIIEVEPKSLVAGLHTHLARPKAGKLVIGYSGYLFQTWALRKQIMRIAQGISVLGISKPNLAKLILPVPHPDEQRKIADFLSALDDKIAAVSAQVDQTQAFKKGLLQQMFV
jgi:type I restriction enzyme, S subunit